MIKYDAGISEQQYLQFFILDFLLQKTVIFAIETYQKQINKN
jgi:hypothetical protein